MLAFDGLGFAYRPGAWVVRGCTGSVAPGRILAVLGPNGQGKSTLLKLLLGVLTPLEGRVTPGGAVALVPQLFALAFDFSALEVVLMGRGRRIGLFAQPGREDEAAALAALERLGVAELARQPFHELSGGQRQLVVLARALVAEAHVLLLDEPTSALDWRNQVLILDRIGRLADEDALAVVFTTHQPQHALAIADEALLLHGAEPARAEPVDAALTPQALARLYGVEVLRAAVGDGLADVVSPTLKRR